MEATEPENNEFLAEETLITVVPNFAHDALRFVTGNFGPFEPQTPTDVPLWLACLLRKRRRIAVGESRTCLFDLDKLAADTQAAFKDYSPETLEEMWAYKSLIMGRIIDSNGGNDYSRRRTAEEREGRKRARGE